MPKCASMLTLFLIILNVQQETKTLHKPRLKQGCSYNTYIYVWNVNEFVHIFGSFIKRETHGILQRISNFYKVDKFSL